MPLAQGAGAAEAPAWYNQQIASDPEFYLAVAKVESR